MVIYDTLKDGLETVFTPHEAEIIRLVWQRGNEGTTTKHAEEHLKTRARASVKRSRATVINFLDKMVFDGVLTYFEESCIGGHRKVYTPKMSRSEFERGTVQKVLQSLKCEFPEATRYLTITFE